MRLFGQLAFGRIIEPNSKLDTIRALAEVGITAAAYPTIKQRWPTYATDA